MEIHAPFVSRRCEPGQFIILRVDENGERIPLTITDYNREKETVTIIFQKVGLTTKKLGLKSENDYIQDFAGPLGNPAPINIKNKRVLGIGGGVGIAPLYPQIKKLKEAGCITDVILGGKTGEHIILKNNFSEISDNIYFATDDGSLGEKGFVTDILKKTELSYDLVIAIGPLIMMKSVTDITKKYNIKTNVSLNPIMIDGTGMCGGCRVTVGGKTKFACVDGPDFDGFEVDFKECMERQTVYDEKHICFMGAK